MFINVMVVALGGAFGSVLRFLLSGWVEGYFKYRDFPYGIFTCNVLGSLVVGIIAGLVLRKGDLVEVWRMFLVVGFCGGFTTFSSFSLDTISLLRQGVYSLAFANVALSIGVCLLASYVGIILIPKN